MKTKTKMIGAITKTIMIRGEPYVIYDCSTEGAKNAKTRKPKKKVNSKESK
jgi:hypothetical protein